MAATGSRQGVSSGQLFSVYLTLGGDREHLRETDSRKGRYRQYARLFAEALRGEQ
jgi:hypothetical protein